MNGRCSGRGRSRDRSKIPSIPRSGELEIGAMRRRDANGKHSLQLTRGGPSTTAAAVVLALALHAGALLALAAVRIPIASTPPLLRVSLLPGGGDGSQRGGGAANSEAPAESSRKAPSNPVREHVAQRKRHRSRPPKARRATLHKSVRPHDPPVAPPPMTTASLGTAAESGGADGVRSADGAGAGTDGSGPGRGHGGGSGDGIGPDARASCVYCPQPHYPLIARARGWQGTVEVLLSVLADGSVKAATLWRSSGYSVLDRAAVAAARHSRFTPPPETAPLRGRMEYRFELITTR
jgi:TonB family protein